MRATSEAPPPFTSACGKFHDRDTRPSQTGGALVLQVNLVNGATRAWPVVKMGNCGDQFGIAGFGINADRAWLCDLADL